MMDKLLKLDDMAICMLKPFLGQGNIIGKETIQEFFNCVGTLTCDDAPILKRTKTYAEAILALLLKFLSRFIRTHLTLQKIVL